MSYLYWLNEKISHFEEIGLIIFNSEYNNLFTKDKPIIFAYHGYKTLIHEQNSVPGISNKFISSFADNDINIRALSIADTTDFGVLRVIVDDVDKAKNVLRENGIISKTTDVLAVYIDDKTGGLAEVLKDVSAAGVSVEYMYAFLSKTQGKALMVLKADDEEGAELVLRQHGIAIAGPDDIK